jgi:hypothetical protein
MRFKTIVVGDADEIFPAIADFGRLESWDPFVDRSELIDGTRMQPGARYRLTSALGLTLEYELMELSPQRRVTYRGGTRRVTSVDTISISPLGSAVEIEIETDVEFEGWTVAIAPLVLAGVWLGSRVRTLPALRRFVARLG